MFLKILTIGLLLALGEIINGHIRVRVLHGTFGKKHAKNISFVSGTAIIYIVCWFALPWIHPESYRDCIRIGCIWLSMMLSLDIYFAKYVFKLKWRKIVEDFNFMKGNLLGVGMVLLFFSPIIVFRLQH